MRSARLIAAGFLAVLVHAAAAQAPAAAEARDPPAAALVREADAEWLRRDEPQRLARAEALLVAAERKAPAEYGVLWRLARLYAWIADDPAAGGDERATFGKRAWAYGDRAIAADPNGVEGWYFGALGVGTYGLGVGIFKALTQGIEGKFKERLSRAQRLDPDFFWGGIWSAWGGYYARLPWPKYDPRKSEEMLRRAIEVEPENVRARVFLAELYDREGHPEAARTFLREALSRPPGGRDPPGDRRSRLLARELLQRLDR